MLLQRYLIWFPEKKKSICSIVQFLANNRLSCMQWLLSTETNYPPGVLFPGNVTSWSSFFISWLDLTSHCHDSSMFEDKWLEAIIKWCSCHLQLAACKRVEQNNSGLYLLDGSLVLGSCLCLQPRAGHAPNLSDCSIQWYRIYDQETRRELISGIHSLIFLFFTIKVLTGMPELSLVSNLMELTCHTCLHPFS